MRKPDVFVIGGVLAVVIATAVVLISTFSSAKESDGPDPGVVQVLVPTRDVPAGQAMDALIEDGHLMLFSVPLEALVEGATTDVSQIEGKTATRLVGKNEQISLGYLS